MKSKTLRFPFILCLLSLFTFFPGIFTRSFAQDYPEQNQQNEPQNDKTNSKPEALQKLTLTLENKTPGADSVDGAEAYLLDQSSMQEFSSSQSDPESFQESLKKNFDKHSVRIPLDKNGQGTVTLDNQLFYNPILWVIYKDAVYTRRFKQQKKLNVTFPVYEPTRKKEVLKINRHHVPIQKSGNKFLITEVFFLTNTSDKAYIGPDGPQTIHFSLPKSARNIRIGTIETPRKHLRKRSLDQSSRIWMYQPVTPEKRQQFKITYTLPENDGRIRFKKNIDYATDKLRIVIPEGDFQIESNFTVERNISPPKGDTKVSMIKASNIQPGKTIDVLLSNITGGGAGGGTTRRKNTSEEQSSNDSSSSTTKTNTYIMMSIGIMALLSFLLSMYLLLKTSGQSPQNNITSSSSQNHDRSIRSSLLEVIAELDDARENQNIDTSIYESTRETLKSIVTDLEQDR